MWVLTSPSRDGWFVPVNPDNPVNPVSPHSFFASTYSDFTFSRRMNFWILPVEVFGSGPKTTDRGAL